MARVTAVVAPVRLRIGLLRFLDGATAAGVIAEVLLAPRAGHVATAGRRVVDFVVAIGLGIRVHDEIGHNRHSILGLTEVSPQITSNRRVRAWASVRPRGSSGGSARTSRS